MRAPSRWRKGWELETREPGTLLPDEDQPGRERLEALKAKLGPASDEELEQLRRDLESGQHNGTNRPDMDE